MCGLILAWLGKAIMTDRRRKVPVKVRPLSPEQKKILAVVYDLTVDLAVLAEDHASVASRYPEATKDGQGEDIQAEVLDDILDKKEKLIDAVLLALSDYHVRPSLIVSLRKLIPEDYQDFFPDLVVNGRRL